MTSKTWFLRPYRKGDDCIVFRPEDEAECQAAQGVDCRTAVQLGSLVGEVLTAVDTHTLLPVAMAGMAPHGDTAGCVWALGSPELPLYARSIIRTVLPQIERWHQERPLLFNWVDARNAAHIQWLRRMGFKFIRRHETFGAAGIPFYEFVRTPACAAH